MEQFPHRLRWWDGPEIVLWMCFTVVLLGPMMLVRTLRVSWQNGKDLTRKRKEDKAPPKLRHELQ